MPEHLWASSAALLISGMEAVDSTPVVDLNPEIALRAKADK
jgi:tRNA (Thr-GGU) A37 N-methylase